MASFSRRVADISSVKYRDSKYDFTTEELHFGYG